MTKTAHLEQAFETEIVAHLTGDPRRSSDGSAQLNAALDPAVQRFVALEEEDADDFRDALTSYVRAYAFLGQVVPFSDSHLEQLYYYGKYLLKSLYRLLRPA